MEWVSLAEEATDGHFDVPAFQARLTAASTLVLHFPLYWYSPPALVKHWLDSMLTPGWAFPSETSQLRGKTLLVSVTTGAALSSFQPDGSNGSTLEELLLAFGANGCVLRHALGWNRRFPMEPGGHRRSGVELQCRAPRRPAGRAP